MASTSYSPGESDVVGEFTVRIPKKACKKYGVMQFNRQTKVDFKDYTQARMERENNLKEFKAVVGEEMPTSGAGSEFGRERREEARRKKYGVRTQNYREEDQPWILKLGGKQGKGKRFKGRKEGLVAENSCYYILKQLPDHSFEAHPVDSFYNFAPMINYRTLNAEEAEEEFGRRDRTMNFFTVMLQRKLKDQPEEGDPEDKRRTAAKSKGLTITEDDEFQDLLMSDNDDSDDDLDKGAKNKKKGKKNPKGGKTKKKKKKVEEDEAAEESDEGDFDARELDYISEESSEGEAEIEEKHDMKGIDQELQKIEDDDQEEEEEKAEQEEDETQKEEGELDKKDGDSESERSDSSESDIDDQLQSPFLMQKKPGKKSSNRSSSRSSTGPSSRSNTPTPNDTTTTLADAANKLQETDKSKKPEKTSIKPEPKRAKTENGEQKFQAIKRPNSSAAGDHPSAKKVRTESPVPRSQTSTPPSEQGITEDVVRRYLMRKPMQTKDLLYKLNPKKVGLSKEEVVKRLTEVLKRLNPDKIKIKDKTYWTIKSQGKKDAGV